MEFQVETTIALFATVVGILLVIGSARRPSRNPKMFKAYALVFFVIAGMSKDAGIIRVYILDRLCGVKLGIDLLFS